MRNKIIALAIAVALVWTFVICMIANPPDELPESAVVTIRTEWGLGSGVIIDSSGLIITAKHVVEDAIFPPIVELYNGERCPAKVYLSPDQDVAILRVKLKKPLPYLELGDSSQLQIGAEIKLIGSPFGERNWHCYGYIARECSKGIIFMNIAGAPGYSGGPVLDENNQVIGIVTQGIMAANMTQGINSNLIKAILAKYGVLCGK